MITMDITQVKATITLSNIPHEITGWSDSSDCLGFADSVELAQFKKGADGKMIASSTGEKGGEVQIKVLANSKFVDRMSAEITLNKAGVQIPVHLLVYNGDVGDSVICTGGALLTAPVAPAYGKGEVSEMVYVFEFEEILYAPVASKR